MPTKHCHHVKVDGACCQLPPLTGRNYCQFHLENLGRRMRMARARARRQPYLLVLPILEDLNSVEVARQHVMDAMASGQLDPKVAGRLLYGLQGISCDLRSAKPPRLGVYDPAIDTAPRATEHPGFEQKHDLPPGLDLSQPPEVVFPPAAAAPAVPAAPAVAVSPAFDPEAAQPSEREARYRKVTATEVELEHLRQEQGREALEQRLRELDRADNLRRQRDERKLVQARYLVEADQRNQATEQRMVADFRAWEEQQFGPRTETAEGEAARKPSATVSDTTDSATAPEKKSGT